MFTVTFTNAKNTILGRGIGTIPSTALVEALADLSGTNPYVSRTIMDEWGISLLDTAVCVGARSIAEHGMTEYPVELFENGVKISIRPTA